MIAGNDIEGDVASVKEFIKNQDLFLNTQDVNSFFVDDLNPEAVKVYDYMHLPGNDAHYKENSNEFRLILSNALNDRMFSQIDYSVNTFDGIPLRMRNLKPEISTDYLDYLESNGMPVQYPVLISRGIPKLLNCCEFLY